MPKRYIIEWGPPTAPTVSSDTSTATFTFERIDGKDDDCPKHPKAAVVDNARRNSPEASGKSHWTCKEIRDILGVKLEPE
jgi:hypothetical protein